MDEGSEDKKQNAHKSVIKRKLNFENYKNCLEANQLENKIIHLEKNKFDVGCPKKDHKELQNNKLKTQQRFKSEWLNFFTEEINKIALSSSDDKIMQSIDSIETYAYRMREDLVSEKKR